MSTIKEILYLLSLTAALNASAEELSQNPGMSREVPIPSENKAKGLKPDMKSAQIMAQELLKVITSNDKKAAADLFFPEEAFMALKDMPGAAKYYQQLVKEFQDHIHSHHIKFKESGELQMESFKPGFCTWKDMGTEYNKIPYWSCYRSEITAHADGKKIAVPIKVMINWGPRWYVTHLGKTPLHSRNISDKNSKTQETNEPQVKESN